MYTLREYSRSGIGTPDTWEVVLTTSRGRRHVLTTHTTRAEAQARLAMMQAPLGTPEHAAARAAWCVTLNTTTTTTPTTPTRRGGTRA